MKRAYIALVAGGTGGHLFPACALAENLQTKNFNPILYCDGRSEKYLLGKKLSYKISVLPIKQFKGGITEKIQAITYLLFAFYQILFLFLKTRPKYIVGFGGYTAFPAMIVAVLLRIPLIIHDQNAVMGRVNRWFAWYAKYIAITFPNTKNIDHKYRAKVREIGNFVRPEVLKSISKKERKNKKFTILSIGGSQGAEILSKTLPDAFALFSQNERDGFKIVQQVREDLVEENIAKYSALKVEADVSAFFNNIGELMNQADIVISRAGASTIAELTAFGKAAILVPYKHAKDNHQYYNAKYLEEHDAAVILEEKDFTAENIKTTILELKNKIADMEKHSRALDSSASSIVNFISLLS